MNEFGKVSGPDEILGDGFEADWQRRHDELVTRAEEVDLAAHFSPEETAQIREELTQFGITDTDQFLRVQVIRYGDEVASAENPVPLTKFTGQVVAGLRDGQFS